LSVAKQIKRASPDTFIIFGGANTEGPMGIETLRSFPWVDAVVSGPGEVALPLIAQSLAEGRCPPSIPGVNYRTSSDQGFWPRHAPEAALDETPPIDFDDFFEDYFVSKLLRECGIVPSVLIETSRGCWWGQKWLLLKTETRDRRQAPFRF